MRLRPALSTDAGRVGGILSEFVDMTPWMPRIHTRAEDLAHAGAMITRGWVMVAETQRGVAGFSACNRGDLNALYVAAGVRGQGIGSALLRHLQQHETQIWLWTFQANLGAQAFYLRHGFFETQRTDGAANDEHLPDIRFEWHEGAM